MENAGVLVTRLNRVIALTLRKSGAVFACSRYSYSKWYFEIISSSQTANLAQKDAEFEMNRNGCVAVKCG